MEAEEDWAFQKITPESQFFFRWMVLFTLCLLLMIGLGGLTRLTGSGLSIVTWKPLSAWFPPFSQGEWELLFQQYQQSPEFQKINFSFSVNDFKSIFWLEYIHRLWGRLIGLILLMPTYYTWRYPSLRVAFPAVLLLWFLGLLQGGMGWYMVKSGLIAQPWVSPYRLMAHLLLGLVLYTVSLTLTVTYRPSRRWLDQLGSFHAFYWQTLILLFVLTLTIIWGGLTAGHKAGLLYNTFPLMDSAWLPDNSFILHPWSRNFLENPTTIQWTHRLLAFMMLAGTVFLGYRGYRLTRHLFFLLWMGMVLVQITLGAITILYAVPVVWGALHQLGAFLLWTLLVIGERGLSLGKKVHDDPPEGFPSHAYKHYARS